MTMSDVQDIYNTTILERARTPRHKHRLEAFDAEAREALVAKTRDAARKLREAPAPEPDNAPPTTDSSVRSAAQTDNPVPEPPFWGRREIEVPLDEVFHHLDTHVLFKLHWGGRGVKGEEWKTLLRDDFQPRLERMWAEQDYLTPRAVLGYFPCNSEGNELIVWDPEAPGEKELERLVCTIHQNQFKPQLDHQWAYLVYAGLWWEPLRGDLDGYIDRVNERVTGKIGIKLYKGHARVVTRSSPNAVYDASLASFSQSGGLFSQTASPGFIELWSLQSRMAWRLRNDGDERD